METPTFIEGSATVMGRIAEALKRAQRERDQHRQHGGSPGRVARRPGERLAPHGEEDDVLAQSTFLEPPEPPKTLTIQAEAITPGAVGHDIITLHDPTNAEVEKYRSLRTRLITGNAVGSSRVYAVTSSRTGEGKTVTTSNLAFAFAELKHLRVAMIDADLRQQGLTRLLKATEQPGLAEVLRGERSLAEVCIPVVRDNLFCIPAGEVRDDTPAELYSRVQFAGFLQDLNDRFHYSFVDTPQVEGTADVGLIAPLCDAALMVARMNQTPEPVLYQCVRLLQANQVSVAGCILTGASAHAVPDESQNYYQGL